MILYNAGAESKAYIEIRIRRNSNILTSYFYMRNKDLNTEFNGLTERLFLDSGAFTAKEKGVDIDIDEYCEYVKKYEKQLEVYANLDVIENAEATLKNQLYMESKGLHPLPTFHQLEDFKYLDYYLENYEYIALGGMVGIALNRPKLQAWLDTCFKKIFEYSKKNNKPLTKVHGFGITANWAWERYPFYSVDSTSWLSYGRYGHSYFEKDKKLEKYKARNIHYLELVEETLVQYQRKAEQITRLWASRGIEFK